MKIKYDVNLEQDPKKSLNGHGSLHPHYTNPNFKEGVQAVFLDSRFQEGRQGIDGAAYDYSDRFCGWFESKDIEEAWQAAKRLAMAGEFEIDSAGYFEAWLQSLFKDPGLKLVHILTGVNMSNGYPYMVYGYFRSSKDTE